jgi:hypothetical protein
MPNTAKSFGSRNTHYTSIRAGNIHIVELHNHGLTEQPRPFYMPA